MIPGEDPTIVGKGVGVFIGRLIVVGCLKVVGCLEVVVVGVDVDTVGGNIVAVVLIQVVLSPIVSNISLFSLKGISNKFKTCLGQKSRIRILKLMVLNLDSYY